MTAAGRTDGRLLGSCVGKSYLVPQRLDGFDAGDARVRIIPSVFVKT